MVKGPKIADIKNFEGFYQIDEMGEVYSLGKQDPILDPPVILSTRVDRGGYLAVRLSRNGQTSTKLIHRLVGQAFLSNPLQLPVINHLDGNKLNNAPSNLQWTNHSGNVKHAYDLGLIKKKTKRVVDITTGELFESVREAAERRGLRYSTLKNYLSGRRCNPTVLRFCDNEELY